MSLITARRDHKRELSGVGRKKASSPDPYCNIRISYEHSPEFGNTPAEAWDISLQNKLS